MLRQARLDAPGTLHHLMVRGIEGTPVFKDKEDRKQFLHHVGELAQAADTRIAAWTLPCFHTPVTKSPPPSMGVLVSGGESDQEEGN